MKTRMIATGTVVAALVCLAGGYLVSRGMAAPAAATAAPTTPTAASTARTSATPTPSTAPSSSVLDGDGTAPPRPSTSPTWVDTRAVGSATASIPVVVVTAGVGVPRGGIPASVDRADTTAVAAAFTRVLLTVDTAIDASPAVAAARAAVYASPAVAAGLAQAPVRNSGADWTSLVDRQGFTVCDTSPASLGDRPADTATNAVRAVKATVTGLSGQGERMWSRQSVVLVSLSRDGAAWVVSSWQYAS